MESQGLESLCYQLGSIRTISRSPGPAHEYQPPNAVLSTCEKCEVDDKNITQKKKSGTMCYYCLFWGVELWGDPQYLPTYPSIHLSTTYVPAYLDPTRCAHSILNGEEVAYCIIHKSSLNLWSQLPTHVLPREQLNTFTHRWSLQSTENWPGFPSYFYPQLLCVW